MKTLSAETHRAAFAWSVSMLACSPSLVTATAKKCLPCGRRLLPLQIATHRFHTTIHHRNLHESSRLRYNRHDDSPHHHHHHHQQQQDLPRKGIMMSRARIRRFWEILGEDGNEEKKEPSLAEAIADGSVHHNENDTIRGRLLVNKSAFPLELFMDPSSSAASAIDDEQQPQSVESIEKLAEDANMQFQKLINAGEKHDDEEKHEELNTDNSAEEMNSLFMASIQAWSNYAEESLKMQRIMGNKQQQRFHSETSIEDAAQNAEVILNKWETHATPPPLDAYRFIIQIWFLLNKYHRWILQNGNFVQGDIMEPAKRSQELLKRSKQIFLLRNNITTDMDSLDTDDCINGNHENNDDDARKYDQIISMYSTVIRMWNTSSPPKKPSHWSIRPNGQTRQKEDAYVLSDEIRNAARHAHSLLDEMHSLLGIDATTTTTTTNHEESVILSDKGLEEWLIAYNSVLSTYSRAAASAAFQARSAKDRTSRLRYKDMAEDAALQAESLLEKMKSRHGITGKDDDHGEGEGEEGGDLGHHFITPNATSYKAILSALTSLQTIESTKKCELLLEQTEKEWAMRGKKNGSFVLDTECYSMVLGALAKIAHTSSSSSSAEEAPCDRAYNILQRMEELSGVPSFEVPISDEELDTPKEQKQEEEEKNNTPDDTEQATSMALVSEQSHTESLHPKPDARCYSSVINAFARTPQSQEGDDVGASRAMAAHAILHLMEDHHQAGYINERPNFHCYGNVITAWLRHGNTNINEAATMAEEVLQKLEHLVREGHDGNVAVVGSSSISPFNRSIGEGITVWYNTVMGLYSRCTLPDAAQRAEDILFQLEQLCADYHTSSSSSVQQQRRRNHTFRPILVAPDVRSYLACISAWARSSSVRNSERAMVVRRLLDRMQSSYREQAQNGKNSMTKNNYNNNNNNNNELSLSVVSCYTAAINACAHATAGGPKERSTTFQIAWSIYDDLCRKGYAEPNELSFGQMIKACMRLLPPGPEQNDYVSDVFRLCCQHGKLNSRILAMVPREIVYQAVQELTGSMEEEEEEKECNKNKQLKIPPEWRRNVGIRK